MLPIYLGSVTRTHDRSTDYLINPRVIETLLKGVSDTNLRVSAPRSSYSIRNEDE